MKKGDKVKTYLCDGFWFSGTYKDDFPESDKILIDSERMVLIASKDECVLVNER